MSPTDAVDGSSTRHVSAMEVGAVKAPTIRRSYPCKTCLLKCATFLLKLGDHAGAVCGRF